MQQLTEAFLPLANYCQFVLYKVVPRAYKDDKLPVDPRTCRVFEEDSDWQNDPSAWTTFEKAATLAEMMGDDHGVGFLLTENDPFVCLDIDGALTEQGWSAASQTLVSYLPGAGIEVSQSGKGLHVFGTYSQIPAHRCRDTQDVSAELYHEKRFMALTGDNTLGSVAADVTAFLPALIEAYFEPLSVRHGRGWTRGPVEHYASEETDEELLARMLEAKSKARYFDDASVSFSDYWENNEAVIAVKFPPDTNDVYDRSKADMAFAQHLAFWTGGNCDRIEVFMRDSAMARDKWDSHPTYLADTIEKAVDLQDKFYSVREPLDTAKLEEFGAAKLRGSSKEQVAFAEEVRAAMFADAAPEDAALLANKTSAKLWIDNRDLSAAELAAKVRPIDSIHGQNDSLEPQRVEGYQFAGDAMQLELFKGCVYVTESNKVLTPDGKLLNQERFDVTYGGYVFQMDDTNSKTTTKAWAAFTQSQVVRWPKADRTYFRPDLPDQELSVMEGQKYVNTYRNPNTPRRAGDATPFLNHMRKLLPNERDFEIIMSYTAAVVQHKGDKFQWCPLIQGTQGNGKSLLSRCVTFAVGTRYTHMPKPEDVDERFNEWMFDNVFIGMEDIYYPESRRGVLETLKPMITNDFLPIRRMQEAGAMAHSCANFIMNSNYKNAIKKSRDDRRYFVVYCPQQSKADKERDGLTDSYFVQLYNWLRREGGYEIVTEYLYQYQIKPEYNPSLANGGLAAVAPESSMLDEVLENTQGGVESDIQELIAEGRPGFAGGWLTSSALNEFLIAIRKDRAIPNGYPRKRLVEELGYIKHPGLPDGRLERATAFTKGRPRLYIKDGHPAMQLSGISQIIEHFENAQRGIESSQAEKYFGDNPIVQLPIGSKQRH